MTRDGGTTFARDTNPPHDLRDPFGPEAIVTAAASDLGVSAIIVVHNTSRGPAMGGLRMVPDIAVREVVDLARAMTWKNAGAMLDYGGGKSALVADPSRFPRGSAERRALMTWFASLLARVPEYTPGPDMFTDEQDMQILFETAGRSIGRPAAQGGIPIDELGLTSLGCLVDLATAVEGGHVPGVTSVRGLRLAVEGFGNVGAAFARLAAAEGAVLVACSDLPDPARDHGGVVHDPRGLDLDALLAGRRSGRSVVDSLPGRVAGRGAASLKGLFEIDADVVVPAARTDSVNLDLARRLRARCVLEAANKPLSVEAERHLHERGVLCSVDYLTNCGGITACAEELAETIHPLGPLRLPRAIARIVGTVRANAEAVYGMAARERIMPRVAAERLVTPRIARPSDDVSVA